MTADRIADLLARDDNPEVAGYIAWARRRRRGEELRLLRPFIAAGLVAEDGGELRLTPAGRRAVRDLLDPETAWAVAA